MSHERIYGLQHPSTLGVKGKKRYAMVVDLDRCNGCMACSVACATEFNKPLGVFRTWVKVVDHGTYPGVKRRFIPRFCNHCDYPPCVRNCPVQATYKTEDGLVLQRYNRCLGCRSCMIACPYNARHLLPAARSRELEPFMVSDKCTFCDHRIVQGVEPACVTACAPRALIFGDLNDPESEVHKLVSSQPIQVLKPDMGTKPQVYYIGGLVDLSNEESLDHRAYDVKADHNAFKRNHQVSHFQKSNIPEDID